MPLDLYWVTDTGTLLPFGNGGAVDPPDPPDPPYDAWINDVNVDDTKFGVTPTGRPYHDSVAVTSGDSATFSVDVSRPFLLET